MELHVGDELDVGFTSSLWGTGFALETRRYAKVGAPVRGHALLPGAQSGESARIAFEGHVSGVVAGDPTTVRQPQLEVTLAGSIDVRWTSFVMRMSGVTEPPASAHAPGVTDSQLVPPPSAGPVEDPRTSRSGTVRKAARLTGRRESRKFPRFDCKLEARYEFFVGPVAERNHHGEVLDISRGGCRLSTGERKEASFSRAFVHLKLPAGDKVRMLAVVRWSVAPAEGRAGSMGVQFEPGQTLAPAYEQYLAQLEIAEADRLARAPPPPEPTPPSGPPMRRQPTIGLREVPEGSGASRQARPRTPPPPGKGDETFPMWRGPGGRIMTPDPGATPEPPLPAAPPARPTPPPAAPPARPTPPAPPPAPSAEEKVAALLSDYLASPAPPPAPERPLPEAPAAEPDSAVASLLRDYMGSEAPAPSADAPKPPNMDFLLYDYLTDDPDKKKKTKG